MAKRKLKKQGRNWKKFWKLGVEDFNTQFFNITKNGELTVQEGNYVYNINDIVKKYGTPTEIVFPFILEERLEDLQDYFRALGSVNELWLVKKMWEGEKFNTKIKVFCNGPKTDAYIALIEELRMKNLSIIPIIEDEHELTKLAKYKGDVGIRVNLDTKADTHWDKKVDRFGFSSKEILDLPKMKNLKVLHYHIGSQIMSARSVLLPIEEAMNLYIKLVKNQPSLDTLDIGGGFGVPYEKKPFYNARKMSEKIVKLLKKKSDDAGIRHPNIAVEWGRYIVAPAQLTIYSIIAEKPIPKANAKSWYVIDGSFMNDLLDTWAIHQKWHIVPVNNANTSALKSVWLAGSSCDSDDKYTSGGSYVLMPKLKEGEPQYLAIFDSGAYQDALASHHCLLSSPAKLIAQDGSIKIARKRESAESIGRLFGWTNGDHKP
ncbi:MAG: Arginine decarboxylase [Candidatus Gottesmanbacteria bacterium GW2011_GWA2_47_9]|uniref:arginine decarboxylase n=1 Tax=Candidatus Gottesmanbacteria bacterium GW2011_GWA2_47_9 TaxID=1618445 RepID=A0A0G1W9Q3_9BACT|nr:MAG: Arginine decarboxylase [Candidatus Gottesmanbacteria bacterium GW2011_GWA2_47_9]